MILLLYYIQEKESIEMALTKKISHFYGILLTFAEIMVDMKVLTTK